MSDDMIQDRDSGLWIPASAKPKERPNFPPRLDIPDDVKGPTRIGDVGAARTGAHFWFYPSRDPRPIARGNT